MALIATSILNVNNRFNNVLRKMRAGQTMSSIVREEGWATGVLLQMQTWYEFDYKDAYYKMRQLNATSTDYRANVLATIGQVID
ncbi:hypothetical protein ACU6W1_05250 [Weissella cibaria]